MDRLKRIIIISIILLLSAGACYGGVRYFVNKAKTEKQLNQDYDPQKLKEWFGINMKPCSDIPKNTKEQAIDIAAKWIGGADGAKKIHAQYCLVTFGVPGIHQEGNTAQENQTVKSKDNYEGRPLWIVSFRGLKSRHGEKYQEELFIVVDDASGVIVCNYAHGE